MKRTSPGTDVDIIGVFTKEWETCSSNLFDTNSCDSVLITKSAYVRNICALLTNQITEFHYTLQVKLHVVQCFHLFASA